jgi:hypothetical protein
LELFVSTGLVELVGEMGGWRGSWEARFARSGKEEEKSPYIPLTSGEMGVWEELMCSVVERRWTG